MGAGLHGAAGERSDGRSGVSVAGFLVTLAVLVLLLFVVLEFVNRWTRIPAPAPAGPAIRTALDVAVRTLSRDLGTAASGPLLPIEAIRTVSDNTPPGHVFNGTAGQVTEIRSGTDQIGLRGILRSPPLALEPTDRVTGRPFPLRADEAVDRSNAPPALCQIKVYASGRAGTKGGRAAGPALSQVAGLLKARPLSTKRKRFFVTGGDPGRFAVARIASVHDRTASAGEGCAPPPDGCHLELILDFADPDAVRLNFRGDPNAVRELGPLSWGGLLDDLVYFVAQGPKGRPPDYFAVNDPLSLAYPRPFLAVGENVGGGRWEVSRVADDVENLQAAYAIAANGAEVWRADRPGADPIRPADLMKAGAELLAVRLAIVAKGTERRPARLSAEIAEEILPFNAPRPDRFFAPLGWTGSVRNRVDFDRETRFISVRFETRR
jgi:hypothetical protein